MSRALLLASLVAGCGFSVTPGGTPGDDGGVVDDDADMPDAPPCAMVGAKCSNDTLVECRALNVDPLTTQCPWGCNDATLPARCGVPAFAGGAVTSADIA